MLSEKSRKYNPQYDPLIDAIPGINTQYAPSYWVATAGKPPEDDGAITGSRDVDVVIIGAGFTGLATAMFLAQEHNIKSTVLEANSPGWGCTSRNGGQGHLAWGRLSRSQWIRRWGEETAKKIHANTLKGYAVFQELARSIDCEAVGDGNLLIAHSASALRNLQAESDLCNRVFDYRTSIISREKVHNWYMKDEEAHGAMVEPFGLAVHPLKLAFGYMRQARAAGASVHPASPVLSWRTQAGKHKLLTPGGEVTARVVIVATAGYTSPKLHSLLAYKNMPIMANCAVTQQLSEEQIAQCNFANLTYATDSRKLRYYYRFLPDKRLQIGTRSAITGADAENPRHLHIVQRAIARKFPVLKGISIEYFWSGWMDISHDMMPRIVQADKQQQIYYAQGYSGNGVAFSAYAAQKLAQLVAGKSFANQDLPIFTSALPPHPLRPLRRLGQRLLFRYYSFVDSLP